MSISYSDYKRNYDRDLANPPEEKPKYWDVHSTITLEYVISRYGTKEEVAERETLKALELVRHLNANDFNIEITDITEQEGE
jgi:hypothetical protein